MSPFFESIRVVNGRVMNLRYHQDRVNRTCQEMHWDKVNLSNIIESVRSQFQLGVYKLRIQYHQEAFQVRLKPYHLLNIQSLQIVHDSTIEYPHKSENRDHIQRLFEQKKGADDILIIKSGLITDSSIGNVILYKKQKIYSPKRCLLPGTMRQKLIDDDRIELVDISIHDLEEYDSIQVINAMRPPSQSRKLAISKISRNGID